MNKTQDLNKSIDSLIEEFFAEPVTKSDALNVAGDAKTTADAAIASAPKFQDDASRGAGRPKEISDVPANDQDGKRDGTYDATIAAAIGEIENEEAKKQSKSIDQGSSAGRVAEAPKMKDPRAGGQVMKSVTEEEYAEFEAFKKSQTEKQEQAKQEELKKSEDLKKAELQNLIKSAVEQAIEPVKKENQDLKKSLAESAALVKAMAGQPKQPKSITGIEALEKSQNDYAGPQEFSKSEKLDAAERLVMRKALPADAAIELENTGTVYNPEYRKLIEAELTRTK
jgi:hypothetical protein